MGADARARHLVDAPPICSNKCQYVMWFTFSFIRRRIMQQPLEALCGLVFIYLYHLCYTYIPVNGSPMTKRFRVYELGFQI